MQKIKLKGVGRPRKRRSIRNPFNLCLSKRVFRKNKENVKPVNIEVPYVFRRGPKEGSQEEAQRIVEVAEQLGLQLAKNRREVVEVITDQLLEGNI